MGRWSRRLAGAFLDHAETVGEGLVLDVGCGTGPFAAAVLQRSDSVTVRGVDIAPVYVIYARRQYPDPRLEFLVGDACDLPFPDASFDQVLSLLVLRFVPRPRDAVAQFHRVAKPGVTAATAIWDARGAFVANRMFFDTAAALDPQA